MFPFSLPMRPPVKVEAPVFMVVAEKESEMILLESSPMRPPTLVLEVAMM